MVGDGQILVRTCDLGRLASLFIATMLACSLASAQTMYKYRGDSGEWIFSDRPPDGGQELETRSIKSRASRGELIVAQEFTGNSIEVTARNSFYAPMEVELIFNSIVGVNYPDPDQQRRWVIPARSESILLDLAALGGTAVPSLQYRYFYLPGDPDAEPSIDFVYRAPFSAGLQFQITQTYPDSITHRTRDSIYAVDVSMPVGTDIVATLPISYAFCTTMVPMPYTHTSTGTRFACSPAIVSRWGNTSRTPGIPGCPADHICILQCNATWAGGLIRCRLPFAERVAPE